MHRPRSPVALALALACLATPGPDARAADGSAPAGTPAPLRAALSARVAYLGLDGERLDTVARGVPFRIEVELVNESGPDPPAGLTLAGWLRPRSDTNLACLQAARAWRATGRVPIGALDLNGPVIAVLDERGALSIVDPELDLASANLVGAARFDERPGALVADPAAGRFLVALPAAGTVEGIALAGGERVTLAAALDGPDAPIPLDDGRFWVLERGTGNLSLVRDGVRERTLSLGAEALHAGAAGRSFAAIGPTGARLIGRLDGEVLLSIEGGDIDDAVPVEDADEVVGLALLRAGSLSIHYRDARAAPGVRVRLASAATRLAPSPDGRRLFAWSPAGGPVSVIDVARGRALQSIGADRPIVDIHVGARAAFLMPADQSTVGVVELASIRADTPANVREVMLGAAGAARPANAKLLSALPPGDDVLAVHVDSYTGFVVHDSSAMGDAPPMTAIRLRGGVPWRVTAIDRGFREHARGRFRAVASLPARDAHEYELVVSTGIGGLSTCIDVPAAAPDTPPRPAPGRITALAPGAHDPTVGDTPAGAAREAHRLRFVDADGEAGGELVGELTFSALEASWRDRVAIETDADGVSLGRYALPAVGAIVVTAAVTARESGARREFRPLLLEMTR